jgi:hypothetical protein
MLPFGFAIGCGAAPCPTRSRGRTTSHLLHRRRGRRRGSLRSADLAGPVDRQEQEPGPQHQLHPDGAVSPSPAVSRCLPATEVVSDGAGERKECTAELRREHLGIRTARVRGRGLWWVMRCTMMFGELACRRLHPVTQRPSLIQCIQPSTASANVLWISWTCFLTIDNRSQDEATWERRAQRHCSIFGRRGHVVSSPVNPAVSPRETSCMASTLTFTWLAAGLFLASDRPDLAVTPYSLHRVRPHPAARRLPADHCRDHRQEPTWETQIIRAAWPYAFV